MFDNVFQRVSQAPTNPHREPEQRGFDVADLYRGPATVEIPASEALPLDEKLRQAYFWIVNHAIISPFYDIEYNDGPPQVFTFGDTKCAITIPSGQSYCSFVLMPLLAFAVRAKCLLVGGPGRGKTASATLMGVLAGYSIQEVRRAIQKGQPQMTVSDLLGTPLPADIVKAQRIDEIGIGWRRWLGMRVKIIDEYNRIPTRTQSALLTIMADNYAEVFDQTFQCPDAAWYLTANDDAGGGTYQVIEALRDRIDIVVKSLHFNTRFLSDLLMRIESGVKPEEIVPSQIVFREEELNQLYAAVMRVQVPPPILRRLEFFAGQFEFCDHAAAQLEYKTKDTAKLSSLDWSWIASLDTGKDKTKDIGAQTQNGMSVRSLMTILTFVKAMAYFRGSGTVEIEDVRQMVPFVLHDKLKQDPDCPYFETGDHSALRIDKISWIRQLFDTSCAEYERLDLDQDDPVASLTAKFETGLDGVSQTEVRKRLVEIEKVLNGWSKSRKFYGHMFDDVLKLKYLHQRYTNYLRWLEWQK
ncbi:MAG: AAA family ATPase [Pirellulaceae bacterium]